MILEGAALIVLALLLAVELRAKGLGLAGTLLLTLPALAPLALARAPGLALVACGACALGTALSRMAAEREDRALLPAALAAGVLAVTGPFAAVGASAAILAYALLDRSRPRAETFLIGALLLFAPLIVLLAIMAAAFIESGDPWGIEAGNGIFVRGPLWLPDARALYLAAPVLLPLALLAHPRARAQAAAPLAIAAGGLAAALFFASPVPLPAFFIAAALIAASRPSRPALAAPAFVLASALAALALFGPAGRDMPVPLAQSWQLAPAAGATPLAWGAPGLPPGAALPALVRRQGRYVLRDAAR